MPFFKSFPEEAEIGDVYRFETRMWKHFREFSRELMRGPSPLSYAERELIAGFVSGLNACEFCHGAHTAAAAAFGLPKDLMPKLLDDLETAPVDDELRPLLTFVRKLTLTPSRMVQADADAVFAAGWDETALHHAIGIAARYSLVNRLVFGHGIEANPDTFEARGEHIARKTYADWRADKSVLER